MKTSEEPALTMLEQLGKLNTHGLSDLNNAKLMNRVDSKFIMPLAYLPELLRHVQPHYSVLEINGNRVSNYFNQYFDTKALNFYQDHHNGRLKRFKVRERCYVDTNTKYLEVKLKNNKKRTIKNRVKLDEYTHVPKQEADVSKTNLTTSNVSEQKRLKNRLIKAHLGKSFDELQLVQRGGYSRIALANEIEGERLTIDFDLWFEHAENQQKVELQGFLIAELKQKKKSKHSPFYQLMSANQIFPTSFSKYCIGCALLYGDSLKVNRFKHTLTKLSRFKDASLNTTTPTLLAQR